MFIFLLTLWVVSGFFFIRKNPEVSGWLAMISDPKHTKDPAVFWVAYVTCLLSGPFQKLSAVTAPKAVETYLNFKSPKK